MKGIVLLLLTMLVFFAGCSTGKNHKVMEPVAVKNTENALMPQNSKPQVETNTNTEESNKTEKTEAFVVTEKVYKQTFNEIKEIIMKLNSIISEKDYETWKSYLTEDYIKYVSNPEFLEKMNSSPILKQQGIVLKSLKDYFYYVVVPSRANARLDKIEIIDKTHVKAITIINDTPIILYRLINVDGSWKIGIM